jgi:hypothetical protein
VEKFRVSRSIVRPIIALAFTAGILIGFFKGMIDAQTFVPIGAVAVTWWFTTRDNEKPQP